jgi:hypothetical protein
MSSSLLRARFAGKLKSTFDQRILAVMPLTLAPTTEPQSLERRLRRVLRLRREAVYLRDIPLALLLSALSVSLAGWLDHRYHLPALVRALFLVGILTGFAFLVFRRIVAPLRRTRDLFAVAAQIEQQNPGLNDLLLSAVQFIEGNENYGSAELRRETIDRATSDCADIDFDAAANFSGVKRTLFAFAVACTAAGWLVSSAPQASETALRRLFAPFAIIDWPAKTTIEIVSPQPLPHRMARGDSLDLQIKFRGAIPERARVGLWLEDGSPTEQAYKVAKEDGAAGEATLIVRLESNCIHKNFRFRVRANDADTGWQAVAVLPPPILVPRDGRPSPQVRLTYPAYTELQPVELADGGSVIEAVTGTRVHIKAATDRPVARVIMVHRPEPPRLPLAATVAHIGLSSPAAAAATLAQTSEVWGEIPVQLTGGNRLIDIDFVPRLPGPYLLRIEDESGLGTNRFLDVRIPLDPSPVVDLHRPSAAKESLALVPEAEFNLVALAQDRIFALRDVILEYRTAKDQPFRRFRYFDSETVCRIIPPIASFAPMPLRLPTAPFPRLQAYALAERMPVARFAHPDGSALKEGDTLFIRVVATDFDNVTLNKPGGASPEVELQIVSKAQIDAALQQALAQMRGELLLLRELQNDARTKVSEELKKLQQSGRLQRDELERLIHAEQTQQQIRARVAAADESLLAQTAKLRQSISDNRLPPSAATRRVEAVDADLHRLADEELSPAESLLGQARKEHDQLNGNVAAPLLRAARHQKEIDETLMSLLERLQPWSGAGEVRGEARSILSELRAQAALLDEFRLNQKASMSGAKREELPPETRDELERSAIRPEKLADRVRGLFEKIERIIAEKESMFDEKLDQMRKKQAEANAKEDAAFKLPKGTEDQRALRAQAANAREEADAHRATADMLKAEIDALRNALKAAGAGELRQDVQGVPERIRNNQLGDARNAQNSAAARLEKLIGSLDERNQAEDSDLLQKRKKDADARLDQLLDGQELLQKKISAAKQIADPMQREDELKKLAPEQEKLEREARELAQQLSRLGADAAAQDVRRAARQMADAREELEQGRPPETNQEEALQRLDEAQDHLGQNRDRGDDEMIREKLAKAADLIRALRERQAAAIDEGKRLHAKVVADKRWKLTSAKETLPALIDQQTGLTKEIRSLAEKRFAAEPVFGRLLRQAAEALDDAVKHLEQRKEDVLDQLEGIAKFNSEIEERCHAVIRDRQELALRRLDQLLESLKPDPEIFRPPQNKTGGEPKKAGPPKANSSEALPPLAALKALRALQADVAERTTAFNKAHPDQSKLTDDELAELDLLRKAQSDVADLVRELTPSSMGDEP